MAAETAHGWGSALDSVVVYAQGAICRRLARGSVPPGGRVRVTGLPRSLDQGSLRARITGAPGVRVVEARVETEAEPLGTAVPDPLQREVERLREEYAAAQERHERQLTLIGEVRSLHPVPPVRRRDDPHRRTPVDAWLELAAFVDERLTRLHTRLADLEKERADVEHALHAAVDRLARASTNAAPAHVETTVSAVVTFDGTGDAEVELEYAVPGAVWVPAYRLTHRQGDSSGRLVLRASIAQRTGEDWTGVRIALATADLRRRTDLPRLRSLRIGRRQPSPTPSGWREPPTGLADLFAGYDGASPRPATTSASFTVGGGTIAAAGGFASAPVPPSPPSLQGYGQPLTASLPAPQGYGAPPPAPGSAYPEVFDTGLGDFAQAVPSRPGGRPRAGGRSLPPPQPLAARPRRRHPRPLPGPHHRRKPPRRRPVRRSRAAPNSTTPPSS